LQAILGLAREIRHNHELYPQLAPYVAKYGLVNLADFLLREDREDLQLVGLELTGFHQLLMVKSAILRLINDEKSVPKVRWCAILTLPQAGINLEDALAGVNSEKVKTQIITAYAGVASCLQLYQAERMWKSMKCVMESTNYSSEVRDCAWFWLSDAHRLFDGSLVLSDESFHSWADKLKVPPYYRVEGLARRKPKDLCERLLEFLKSEDALARGCAASYLARLFNEPKALPVLVDSLPSFGVPMWRGEFEEVSLGFCALDSLASVNNGALVQEMWSGLTPDEKKFMDGVVGKGSGAETLEERVMDFLTAPDTLHIQEKNKIASIMMSWFKHNLAGFHWDPDTPRLHLIKPAHQ
jgi:hypothetical protein